MATWKKISVSGSNISQFNNDAGYLTSATDLNAFATASINGVDLLAGQQGQINFVTASGEGITAVGTPGTDTVTLGLSSIPNSSLANSTIYISGSGISNEGSVALGATASIDIQVDDSTIGLTGNSLQVKDGSIGTTQIADSLGNINENSFTGSFSGSFTGDVTIDLADLTQGTGITAFTYDGNSTATVSIKNADNLTDNTLSKWDDGNGQFVDSIATDDGSLLTVTGDQLITGDLTVQGTASFESRNDLLVADRFILMASGSTSTGDGGIVVQQDTQNIGELFGFDSGTSRWAVTSSFNAGTSTFTPSAFMATVIEGTGTDPDAVDAQYDKKGNIFVGTDEEIWIYS